MFKDTDIYIDLGTANTLIYGRGRGFLLNEPSLLAVKHSLTRPQQLFGLGRPAKKMLGKTPGNISIVRPLREGVIADFESTARMLHAFVGRIRENTFWLKPRMLISLPCQVTPFEKRAVEEVGYGLGAGKVFLLDEPMAAAIGSGLSVLGHRGHMVVDIGGGTTEIAVISLGGIVTSTAVRVGGDAIDDAIIEFVRNQFKFVIGEQTAERIKCSVGSVSSRDMGSQEILDCEVGGIDLVKGLPSALRIDSTMLLQPIESVVKVIIQNIRATLEKVPPEIASDIAENGILCTGGGALLKGMQERLAQEFGVKVTTADQPLLSVALGGAKALEDRKFFEKIQTPA